MMSQARTSRCGLLASLLIIQLISLVPLGSAAVLPPAKEIDKRDDVPAGYYSPSYFPTPHGGWLPEWADSYKKAAALVANMSIVEKVNLTTGTGIYMGPCVGNTGSATRVGIPRLCLQDGPLGIRNTDHNTAFPAGITVGATWDKDLMYARGVAIGAEFRGKGINIHLGPSVGALGRKPRGGRNWEGFGADPVLQAAGGSQTIRGVQSQGVIATIKHFIANEQEMYRMTNLAQREISSNVDDRTLHELYLWPFAEGVRAGVGAVMTAYNAVNGSTCSQNSKLVNGILKDELGFQGLVMSDWLGHIAGVAAALSGLDMSMPGDGAVPLLGTTYWSWELTRAVLNGTVPVDRLNDMATRIIATWFQLGQDKDYPLPNFSTNTQDETGPLYPGALVSPSGVVNKYVVVNTTDHAKVARQIAQDAVTLLKNDGILPLSTSSSFKVFGTDAQANPDGINACSDRGCDKGTLGEGWGSGTANYPYIDSPIDAIKRRASNVTAYITDSFPSGLKESANDVALVFINADSGENYITVEGNPGDRTDANLYAWHSGDNLVKAAANVYSKVVVVVHTVGPILLENWIDLPSVKAVVFAHLPGQEAGDSLTAVLFGDVSPSGHLPYTIAYKEVDYGASVALIGFELGQPQDTFSEGLYVDYRHFTAENITARFPFGHGLSYTTFSLGGTTIKSVASLTAFPSTPGQKSSTPSYPTTIPAPSTAYWPATEAANRIWRYLYPYLDKSDADGAYATGSTNPGNYPYPPGYTTTQRTAIPLAGGSQGGNPALWDQIISVSTTVTNSGSRAGKAVVQAYIHYPDDPTFKSPPLQLRDFVKTKELKAGESATVSLTLTRKDLSVWDTAAQNWRAFPGGKYQIYLGFSVVDLKIKCETSSLTCGSV